jgi:2',3'-cyclic-nucleotide 2'-phosphodiesterase (5'-nucleotidase family)
MHRLFSAFLILFLCAGCYPADAPGAPPATAPLAQPPTVTPRPLDLTIIHTNDTWGYLLPCG